MGENYFKWKYNPKSTVVERVIYTFMSNCGLSKAVGAYALLYPMCSV